jgi:hypothetical protein
MFDQSIIVHVANAGERGDVSIEGLHSELIQVPCRECPPPLPFKAKRKTAASGEDIHHIAGVAKCLGDLHGKQWRDRVSDLLADGPLWAVKDKVIRKGL